MQIEKIQKSFNACVVIDEMPQTIHRRPRHKTIDTGVSHIQHSICLDL
jgi:hypothetical protein